MISEKLVFCVFPKTISVIDRFYKTTSVKSKWFSILVAIDDTTLAHTHYFNVAKFEPYCRDMTKPMTNNIQGVTK